MSDPSAALPPLSARPAWWQWPTVLSLDAPAVALAWQVLFGRIAGGGGGGARAVLLAASVWLAYSADRWIEGWRLSEQTVRTQRHRFFMRWRWPAFVVWLGVLSGAVTLAVATLTREEWVASTGLLGVVAIYLLSHQLLHRGNRWRPPKEVCVASIFTGGCALYPMVHPAPAAGVLVAPVGVLFTLALANCLLISVWEAEVDRLHGQSSLAQRMSGASHWVGAATLVAVVVGAGTLLRAGGAARVAGGCGVVSGMLLLAVHRMQPRIGRERARVWADAVLLTPWVAGALGLLA